MKAIVVMFDTLNRRLLPPYGCDWTHAPNFARMADAAVTFDNCYAGSMPCMPARREMHTGRYNFLHRSWGPLEPFDDSMPEMLRAEGIYTHLVTDHQHYWEDGGATFHNRFSTYEFFRGQEGDAWKGVVEGAADSDSLRPGHERLRRQDSVNRKYLQNERDHPQTKVFDAGVEFVRTNAAADDWMIQIETFDPHEPFFSYAAYKDLYPHEYAGPDFDWPQYKTVDEPPEMVAHARNEYAALLSMCDASLGRVLDEMDELGLWDDTMLIVCTDHGFLLGEHGWWGKLVQPWYDENIHTPLFVWDPRTRHRGERRRALVQSIDFAPTILAFFGVSESPRMEGVDLADTIATDRPVREAGLFGAFGAHVNVTDGRWVYMRAAEDDSNEPLEEYTLMPTHMRHRFDKNELAEARLVPGFAFTDGTPVLQVPGTVFGNSHSFGTLLFDLETDPQQRNPVRDDPTAELRMITLLVDLMRRNEAPPSQFERLGLPAQTVPDSSHLRCGDPQ